MEKKLSHPKPPKEKKTIHGAIQGFIANGQTFNANTIAKAVGVSRHRVLKYCKSHGIELDKLNDQVEQGKRTLELQTTTPEVKAPKAKKKAAIKLSEPAQVKIQLATPNQVKIKLADREPI
ncbi:hypothetical protein [Burkholderia cenocepacia]|uniref:hypothetical protein n=1 Tax=Burkholderia cenocepacia TaxID=95486 RepID=UPI0009818DDC|nr:hypothetical protein [Burkholderia cenocepacia]ONU47779.1 hypothetical protein A8E62_32185 [Burkholderia cenocepacia]